MKKIVAAVGCSVALFSACSSSNKSTSATPPPTTDTTSAFCADVKALGSLSKGVSDAMAMSPSESMKDFEALAAKVTALKANAPADVTAAIDTVAARFKLEAKAEEMMAGDPNGATEETKMLADHKADDDVAAAKLVAAAKSSCNVDLG
jgi:hypothetical protein